MAQGQKTGGRQAGTPNRITRSFKEAVQIAYDAIGGHRAFADWARENQTDFYRIASRLIPTEIATRDVGITVILAPTDSGGRVIIGDRPQLSHTEH